MPWMSGIAGLRFGATAHERLNAVPEKRLAAVSALFSDLFRERQALSTLFDDTRPHGLSKDQDADLHDLEAALPAGSLLRDTSERDRYSAEPRSLAFIRELEGARPQSLAVLSPANEEDAREAVSEARAMGYALIPGDRHLALKVPAQMDILDKTTGHVRFSAGVSWAQFDGTATTAGLAPCPALARHFTSPIDAAQAGLFGPVKKIQRFRQLWAVDVTLPPVISGMTEVEWLFEEPTAADHAFRDMVRQIGPLMTQTYPALDRAFGAAAGLNARKKAFQAEGAMILRCLFQGIDSIRYAMVKASDTIAKRMGGRTLHLKPLSTGDLEAVLTAAGGARLMRAEQESPLLPQEAKLIPCAQAIGEEMSRYEVIYYIRDLERSLTEAQQILGLPEDPVAAPMSVRQEPPLTKTAHG